ncbi:hypothetical protein [Methanolapillus ohkumae]|uniref:Type II toxin-antitoxin system HicA family toxin n=1 Tax=Methanolapillus ohkumae TaxID=3028298 RepID=A0AA96VJ75_9EURY|nr:hypothetical protein MsAm2_12180 [Methanosarcinaceae archaeon Am2]
MIYKTRKIASALKRKGFEEDLGDDHKNYYYLDSGGRRTEIQTKISHGLHEYDESLLSSMQKQLHLDKQQFRDLIECSLTKGMLVNIYSDSGKN